MRQCDLPVLNAERSTKGRSHACARPGPGGERSRLQRFRISAFPRFGFCGCSFFPAQRRSFLGHVRNKKPGRQRWIALRTRFKNRAQGLLAAHDVGIRIVGIEFKSVRLPSDCWRENIFMLENLSSKFLLRFGNRPGNGRDTDGDDDEESSQKRRRFVLGLGPL